jgi:hypothetical protein
MRGDAAQAVGVGCDSARRVVGDVDPQCSSLGRNERAWSLRIRSKDRRTHNNSVGEECDRQEVPQPAPPPARSLHAAGLRRWSASLGCQAFLASSQMSRVRFQSGPMLGRHAQVRRWTCLGCLETRREIEAACWSTTLVRFVVGATQKRKTQSRTSAMKSLAPRDSDALKVKTPFLLVPTRPGCFGKIAAENAPRRTDQSRSNRCKEQKAMLCACAAAFAHHAQ